MTSRQLALFIAVVETGSITKAAEKLYISPQALAQQLKKFERELGFELLRRTPGGSSPTEAGLRFYEGARHLVEYSERLVQECRSIANRGQRLRVGQIPFALHSADIARTCGQTLGLQRPEMVLLSGADESALDAVATGLIDVIEWVDEPAIERKGLVFEHACDIKHVCIVNMTSPLAAKASLSVADLVGYRLHVLRRQWYGPLFAPIDDQDTTLRVEERPSMGYQDVVSLCSEDDNVVVTFGPNLHKVAGFSYVPLDGIGDLDVGIVRRSEASPLVDGYVSVYRKVMEGA